MDFYDTVFELIDMRSFSNLWYWIALAVLWSSASHYVLGVPYDMILRARRGGDGAETDLHDLVRVNVNRILHISDTAGLWITAFVSAAAVMLGMLGFWYGIEFAQALFLLGFPLVFVGLMSIRTARRLRAENSGGERLYRRLRAHRIWTQAIGMVSIFITAFFGMYQNASVGVLGGAY